MLMVKLVGIRNSRVVGPLKLCTLFMHFQEISGLQNCLQLQQLYLYDNHISEIANLEPLVNLEVLWLNSNCITKTKVILP